VVLLFASEPPLRIDDAFLGSADAPASVEAVRLRLNDAAMGISLRDRLRGRCPPESTRCAVWLEGAWGAQPLGDEPEVADGGPKRWPFAVFRLVDRAEEPPEHGGEVTILVEEVPGGK
jgi:hypothetical protein